MISKKIRVFINGFGRIGRSAAKIMLQDEKYELVGINDLYIYEQMAYLLKYDSIYGILPYDVKIEKDNLLNDLSIQLKKETTKEEVNKAFKKEIEEHYQAFLAYSETLQASDEYIKNSYSAVLNLPLTSIVGGNLLRVSAWQDNEYGYAKRLVDMVMVVEKSING